MIRNRTRRCVCTGLLCNLPGVNEMFCAEQTFPEVFVSL